MIAGLADADRGADLHLVDDGDAAGARSWLAQHADQVAVPLARIVAQRILAHEARRDLDIDVRTGAEPLQDPALGIDKFEAGGVFGLRRLSGDLERLPGSG